MEKQLGWVCKLSGAESLEISKVDQTVLVRLMESHLWHHPADSVECVGSDRGHWPLSAFLSGRKLSPGSLLMPDTSFPPCVPLVSFKLLHWCWSSEGVSLSKSVHESLKRNCLGLNKFLSLTQFLLVFAARSYGDLSTWHWNPGLGAQVWDWHSSLPRYPTQIFIHHRWVWGPPVPCLHPPLPVWMDVVSLIT